MIKPNTKIDIYAIEGLILSDLKEIIIPTKHYIERLEQRYDRSLKKGIKRVIVQLKNNKIYKSFRKRKIYRSNLKFTKWIDLGEYQVTDTKGYKHIFNIDKGKIVLITIKNPTVK